jgi:hypothetical protein
LFGLCRELGVLHPDFLLASLSVAQLEEWIAYDMVEPLQATVLDQMRRALCFWKQAPPAPADGPLDFKEEAIWKMLPQAKALISGADTPEKSEQYRKDFEDWVEKINALEAPLDE